MYYKRTYISMWQLYSAVISIGVVLESGNRWEYSTYFSGFGLVHYRPSDSSLYELLCHTDFCILTILFVNVASTDNCCLISTILSYCYCSPHAQIVNIEFCLVELTRLRLKPSGLGLRAGCSKHRLELTTRLSRGIYPVNSWRVVPRQNP